MIIETEIFTVSYGGRGLGRHNGKICFVPGSLPGERVACEIVKEKKKLMECRLIEILRGSPSRMQSPCPYSLSNNMTKKIYCPGCSYMHCNYSEEVQIKNKQLGEFLYKFAGVDHQVLEEPFSTIKSLGYRNKITLHTNVEATFLGYYCQDNEHVIKVNECLLANSSMNQLLQKVQKTELYAKLYTLRYTERNGTLYWSETSKSNVDYLTENIAGLELKVPAKSFFQVNPTAHNFLLNETARLAEDLNAEYLIDLYCGVGVFSVYLGKLFHYSKILLSDLDRNSISAAEMNLSAHGLKNFTALACPAEKAVSKFSNMTDPAKTLLIVDPPRSGLNKKVLETLTKHKPKNILYVSCAPDTLCRDLKTLTQSDYNINYARMIDMFPRTSHFESMILLQHTLI